MQPSPIRWSHDCKRGTRLDKGWAARVRALPDIALVALESLCPLAVPQPQVLRCQLHCCCYLPLAGPRAISPVCSIPELELQPQHQRHVSGSSFSFSFSMGQELELLLLTAPGWSQSCCCCWSHPMPQLDLSFNKSSWHRTGTGQKVSLTPLLYKITVLAILLIHFNCTEQKHCMIKSHLAQLIKYLLERRFKCDSPS